MNAEKPTLCGVYPPITTPFASDGTLALDRLRENINKYNQTKLAGYVVVGSTGESVYLREEEKLRIWETVRNAADSTKLLIAGTGQEATAETIALTRCAADLGYRVALVRTPSYFKPQMDERALERHFRAVADASPIPILIYSVPQFTGLAVETPLVARLAEHPNISGIKESSGNIERITQMIAATPEMFSVLVGSASTLYPSLNLGARGGILAAACAWPEMFTNLYEAVCQGDHDRARALQQKVLPAVKLVTSTYGITGLKYALDLRGYYGGPTRPPLLPPDAKAQQELAGIVHALEAPS
ncbi:MAG: dihydrodipicolinate synthase family protein [Terriglobia bacterium]